MLLVYSVILFLVVRKYFGRLSDEYSLLLKTTNQIAEGNLDIAIEEDLGVFEPFKNNLQKIQNGFKLLIQEEIKSQKLKTDLISNMSHDLKTPLTAIITYVSLLKDDRVTPEQRQSYIDVLEKKSLRLKSLIEDLFEISKANSNNVTLDMTEVDIVSLLKEVSLELSDKIKESTIDFRWNLPDEKILLSLDGQKTYRIFDNLLSNIIKYAMPNTRAYIDLKVVGGEVAITLKNVSAAEITLKPEEITERFARGDESRNTEGSGLGMAIAKSFVELQNGRFQVEVEADLFRVIIRWPVSRKKIP
jgi:signal transduction histidine kinase